MSISDIFIMILLSIITVLHTSSGQEEVVLQYPAGEEPSTVPTVDSNSHIAELMSFDVNEEGNINSGRSGPLILVKKYRSDKILVFSSKGLDLHVDVYQPGGQPLKQLQQEHSNIDTTISHYWFMLKDNNGDTFTIPAPLGVDAKFKDAYDLINEVYSHDYLEKFSSATTRDMIVQLQVMQEIFAFPETKHEMKEMEEVFQCKINNIKGWGEMSSGHKQVALRNIDQLGEESIYYAERLVEKWDDLLNRSGERGRFTVCPPDDDSAKPADARPLDNPVPGRSASTA